METQLSREEERQKESLPSADSLSNGHISVTHFQKVPGWALSSFTSDILCQVLFRCHNPDKELSVLFWVRRPGDVFSLLHAHIMYSCFLINSVCTAQQVYDLCCFLGCSSGCLGDVGSDSQKHLGSKCELCLP